MTSVFRKIIRVDLVFVSRVGPVEAACGGSSLVCANNYSEREIGWGSEGMQRPVHPLVPLAKQRQTRARSGSRSMDWPLQHHL